MKESHQRPRVGRDEAVGRGCYVCSFSILLVKVAKQSLPSALPFKGSCSSSSQQGVHGLTGGLFLPPKGQDLLRAFDLERVREPVAGLEATKEGRLHVCTGKGKRVMCLSRRAFAVADAQRLKPPAGGQATKG